MKDTANNELTIDNLSTYREGKDLTVANVANTIKVSSEVIKHIEQGNFNKIGAPTFIKGHVSNYAKAIGLDPQTVLALIPAEQLTLHSLKLTNSRVSSPLSRVKIRSSGFGKYVFGTFLVAALALSFYFVYDKWDQQQDSSVQLLAEQQNELPVTNNSSEKRVIYSSLLPQADLSNGGQSNLSGSNLQTEEADEPIVETGDEADAEVTENEPNRINEEADSATLNDTEPDQTSNQAFDEPATEGKYQIKLELAEQAWVAIEGQDGSRVVADLLGPGERTFSANQPLQFRIGNASAVALFINDQHIDLAVNTQQNVAKLSWPPVID